ncbi:MAG: hypothetical protein WD294_12775 [Phycisphaeraceae bacterium]
MKLPQLLALTLLAAAGLQGCVKAPYGMSLDRHNISSTTQHPKRLTLVDSTNGETVWSMDIPVGETLVVDFEQPTTWTQSEYTGAEPADAMRWNLFETSSRFGSLDERVKLSGNPVYMRVEMREIEEAEIQDATFTPVEEPPLPDAELERVEPQDDQPPQDEDQDEDQTQTD